ncbi:phosphoribosyltransferase family protein [uncultured Microbacterium sp.]|uniref:phosphoribosyltransferase family protein n=1 Tax=uncultured Microbacterium sp. TaxID=191216 RepID=UPI00258FA7DC|nr:phosphoribosyltransferase family protein [uncultured Microbacterium sp.]
MTMSGWAEARWLVREAFADAAALAFPVRCAGCGADGRVLCAACRVALVPRVSRRTLEGGLSVWSGGEFDGMPARVLRAAKQTGQGALAAGLAPLLRASAEAAASSAAVDVIVRVPSSRAAVRRRGFVPLEQIAARARLCTTGGLRVVRPVADQRGLDEASRHRNADGSMRVRRVVAGLRVLVVDDVVTTGATLHEAAAALRAAGAVSVVAATVLQTPRRR